MQIDVSSLPLGWHTISAMIDDNGVLSSPISKPFIKKEFDTANPVAGALILIDDIERERIPVSVSGNFINFTLDARTLSIGPHTLTTALVNDRREISQFSNELFMRIPTQSELSTLKAYYVIDDDLSEFKSIDLNGYSELYRLNVDLNSLPTGIHTITMYLASPLGLATETRKSYFLKIPNGGEGIIGYEYWIDDSKDRTKVLLESPSMPLSLIKMIDVPEAKFRSSSYELRLEDGNPVVYGMHDFNFICYDGDYRSVNYSHEYMESRIRKEISDITEIDSKKGYLNISALPDQGMKWFAIGMQTGDSISLRIARAGTIDVFTPKGERCYHAYGDKAYVNGGFHAQEDGKYLISVHDVIGNSSTSLSYEHIDKYAIISTGPKRTATADMFVLNLTGNGMEALKEVVLTDGNNEYPCSEIHVLGYGQSSCVFNLEGAANGNLNLVAKYEKNGESETLMKDNILQIEDARPGEITCNAFRAVFGTTLNDVTITIRNNGNVPYWGIPLNIAAEADGSEVIKMNFKDFIPNMPGDNPEDWEMFFTDNLLGTGRRGGYLPLILPYLGPNEMKEITLVYQMPLTTHIPTYVWAGRPYSDEFKEMIRYAEEGKEYPIDNRNYISAPAFSLAIAAAEQYESSATMLKKIRKAHGQYVDISGVNNAVDLAGRLTDNRPLNNANTLSAQAIGLGHTMAGIHNGMRVGGIDAYGIDLSDETYSSLANYRNDLVLSMPNPTRIATDSFGGLAGSFLYAMSGGDGGCAACQNPMPQAVDIVQMTSCDPNDITGYQDPSGGRHVGIETKTIPYTIEFENDPALATASAHVITIQDKIDPNVFDLSTFTMKQIEIGEKIIKFENGESTFVTTLDMRPEINCVAEITCTLDQISGETEWLIRSLDPMTLEAAGDVNQGVLPINYNGSGCGKIMFDIDLKENITDKSNFSNSATIIFDANDPIDTPVWENTIDYVRPEMRISSVEYNDGGEYEFKFEVDETGSGLWMYELYHLPSGGTNWTLLKGSIPADSNTYHTEDELIGSFCVLAVDKAGNRQTNTSMSALLGDADDNGIVDSSDIVVLQNYFIGKNPVINKIAGDINIDYVVDAQDAVAAGNLFLSNKLKKNKHVRTRKTSR